MSDIELNPTGEMLLDCMDKLERIQTKHTALVEAVEELMSLDYEDDFDQGKFFKAWNRVEQALAAAKEEA